MRILVVEDNALLGDGIQAGLRQQGFTVDWVQDGVAADLAIASEPYAAIVLDLGLPRRSGLEVLKDLRRSANTVPVLILTARDAIADRVAGLDSGADDYLVKPFDLAELAARLRALTRRASGQAASTLTVGALSLDHAARTVRFRNEDKALSAREFDLLHALMRNAGRVMSPDQLASALYAWGEEIESNAIDVHLHYLRKKLSPDIVQTLRGVGYLMPKEIQ
jgi:two-component system OmpR family response regulator/two-component system response regulator QseB